YPPSSNLIYFGSNLCLCVTIIVVVMMVMVVVITLPGNGIIEQHIYTPWQPDRFPTYPYIQNGINLPPTISLSDGEEPPPYQGPCTLQLQDPEQQMELNRKFVRAPPNRTIFDCDLIDSSVYGGPSPPSSHSGISATSYSSNGRMEGPPSSFYHCQQPNLVAPSILESNRLQPQNHGLDSTIARSKDKARQKGQPF
uniref:Low density lipoprotein receptor class A domain containing 4 n=1 Tax=Xenopus tropicalis TaxID=8364 RepID=A0A6I8SQ29_XENTR